MAVGASSKCSVSTDGVNWTLVTAPFPTNTAYGVATDGTGRWHACGAAGKVAYTLQAVTDPQLTIAGAQTDGFAVSDTITSDPAGGGPGVITAIDDTNVTVTAGGTWAVGQRLVTRKQGTSTTLYCVLDGSGNVTDMQAGDPGFTAVTMSGPNPYTQAVTFPATLPSGNAPDAEFPAGTTITTEVQATNAAGSDTAVSNTVTPT